MECSKCGSVKFITYHDNTVEFLCASTENHRTGEFTQTAYCMYRAGAKLMTRVYETPNVWIMAWLVIMRMGAITMPSGRVHYKYPKDHPDNTLFRDLEELAHILQHRDIPNFVIKYVWAWRKGYKNAYEIKAKAQAEMWLKQKPNDMDDDTYLKKVCKSNNVVLTP